MNNRYAWSRRSDDEIWRGGPCDSIKECVEEALADEFKMEDTFALGYIEDYNMNLCFADHLIEYLQEDAYDELGEVAYDWLDSVSKEQREVLNDRIINVVKEWLKEIHRDGKETALTNLQGGALQTAPIPITSSRHRTE